MNRDLSTVTIGPTKFNMDALRYGLSNLGWSKSLLYSLRYQGSLHLPLPLMVSWNSKIIMEREARLDIRRQLVLGCSAGMLGDDGATIKLAKRSTLDIRGIVRLGVGTLVIVDPGALVEIGGKTFVTGNSSILCAERVSMGEECAIAWNVLIMDSDFHRISNRETMTRPIKIGNHVWIGCGVTILKGVNVGEGAVIAAAALVASDVPPHSLVAGNPARVVRSNVEWSKS